MLANIKLIYVYLFTVIRIITNSQIKITHLRNKSGWAK